MTGFTSHGGSGAAFGRFLPLSARPRDCVEIINAIGEQRSTVSQY
jgi:hypothetical protein